MQPHQTCGPFTIINCLLRLRTAALKFGGALPVVLLICASSAHAQVPEGVIFSKIGYHAQVSATKLDPVTTSMHFVVYLPETTAASVTVHVKKPNGALILLNRDSATDFSFFEVLANEALLAAAYPDGSYQVLVAGGSINSTTTIVAKTRVLPPVRMTNYDSLQVAAASPQVTWEAIPIHGSSEELYLQLYSSGGVILRSETLPNADVVSDSFEDLLPGESYTGLLTYFAYELTSVNSGQTEVVMSSGFSVYFPVLRGAATLAAPATPAAAGAYASGPTEATVAWQPPGGANPATGYKLERAGDAAFTTGLITLTLGASTTYVDTTVAPNTTYYYRLSATNGAGTSAPTAGMQVKTPASAGSGTSRFVNIATRAMCSTGNNVTIGGFVVGGTANKRVLLRAVGPSLTAQGIGASEVLLDPMIAVHKGTQVVATNDNWSENGNVAEIATVGAQIGATSLIPTDTKSAVLLVTLTPGVYSFVVTGNAGTSGIVLLEVYDADDTASSFVNIATRAYSTTGNGVTIGGFVINGGVAKQVLIRAVGPTLSTYGLPLSEVLADPVIELHRGAPVIATNDNWASNGNASEIRSAAQRIGAASFASSDEASSALLLKLPPGVYSFIARSKSNASGIVLVEVYDAD